MKNYLVGASNWKTIVGALLTAAGTTLSTGEGMLPLIGQLLTLVGAALAGGGLHPASVAKKQAAS